MSIQEPALSGAGQLFGIGVIQNQTLSFGGLLGILYLAILDIWQPYLTFLYHKNLSIKGEER